jgi:transposase
MAKHRRHFASTEKVAILRRHLIDRIPISDLSDELDIQPTQLYDWLKKFFENGHSAFDTDRKSKADDNAKDEKIEKLEAKIVRKDAVMAELLEAHTLLKKELGEI